MRNYEELKTPEAVMAAFEVGRRVEYAARDCVWCGPMKRRPRIDVLRECISEGCRYRALIEDAPPIPEGFKPWAGGECPEDARGRIVSVICRDGESFTADSSAVAWFLPALGADFEIIAYRVESMQAQPSIEDAQPIPVESLGRADDGVKALADREAFEVWVRSWCEKEDDAKARLTWANGCYDNEEIQHKYVGFRAARRLRPQVDAAMVERAAKYGWQHASWDWENVRGGLDRFRRAESARTARPNDGEVMQHAPAHAGNRPPVAPPPVSEAGGDCSKTAEGGAVGPYHAVRDDSGHAHAIADASGRYIVHLERGTTRNESEGGVTELLRLLNAPAGSGEAVAYCDPHDPINSTAFAWPGSDRDISRHTMPLYAEAALSSAPIGYGDVIDGRLMSYSHESSERCRTRVYAGAAPAVDAEAIERAAEAICNAEVAPGWWPQITNSAKVRYRRIARAALVAGRDLSGDEAKS